MSAVACRLAVAAATLLLLAVLVLRPSPVRALDVERMRAAAAAMGPRAEAGARDLLALLQRIASADEVTKAREVNDFYNRRIRYDSDEAVWGQLDYWATPLQTLDKGRGDCEDFAIAKYYTLVAAGVPHERLFLAYAAITVPPAPAERPGDKSVSHMVLVYYPQPSAEPFILDNIVREVRLASKRPDLTITSQLNAPNPVRVSPTGQPIGARSSPPRLMLDLLGRVAAEGF